MSDMTYNEPGEKICAATRNGQLVCLSWGDYTDKDYYSPPADIDLEVYIEDLLPNFNFYNTSQP